MFERNGNVNIWTHYGPPHNMIHVMVIINKVTLSSSTYYMAVSYLDPCFD